MFKSIKSKLQLDNEKWDHYIDYFHRIEMPSKTILLEEGSISKKMYIIEKGCIRVWINNNGKDITTQFFIENEMVGSIESFRKNIPSPTNIETMEPCVLWWISKENLDTIVEEVMKDPRLRNLFVDKIFERTFDYMKYFISTIKYSPLERYLQLLKERPEIIQRVPQHYIASYLGISSVHLSRIKNQIHKEK